MKPPGPPPLPAELSARTVFGTRSMVIIGVITVLVVLLCFLFPHTVLPTLSTAIAALYLISTTDRIWLLMNGIRCPGLVVVTDEEARSIPDSELPRYTVLLPVYHEPTIVQNLLNGVGRIEYPHDKIEILLLTEEDDTATAEALTDM